MELIERYWVFVLGEWYRLPPDYRFWAVNAFFVAYLALMGWFSYFCIRRGLGHHRYQGRWYNAQQFEAIVQELYSGVKDGRVPDHETMQILDRYVYGRNGSLIRNMTRGDI